MNNLCEKMKDKITDYVLGILNESEIVNLEEHIEQCAECKEHLENLQREREVLLQLGENIDSKMNAREESVIAALEKISNKKSVKSILFSNRAFRFAAAAIIAIALLIPLSYGANNLIKRLIAGSVEYDDYKGDFGLDKDIRFELQVGNKEKDDIISASNIRFFVEDGELRGTIRFYLGCVPKFKWITKIELFDSQNRNLASTEHVNENTGIEVSNHSSYPCTIHFTLGKWEDVSNSEKFIIAMKEASDSIKTTPDTWYESEKLNVVRGYVTGHDGKPIANAVVQIREKRKQGQSGITAPDVITDENGFYSYDGINWEYNVGVLVYDPVSGRDNYKHQYKRLNKYIEASHEVDFEFEDFPTGNSAVFGTVQGLDGQVIKEFSIDLRLKVDFQDYSQEYLNQFGYKRPFITKDGKYDINNLPAGVYNVTIYPTINGESKYSNRREYVCELHEGQRLEVGIDNTKGKIYYGRVLFEDGTPAVPELSEYKTQIIEWAQDSAMGSTKATVDDDGYFQIQSSEEIFELYQSGKAWLIVGIAESNSMHNIKSGERFPFSNLSSEKENAEVMYIERPTLYYGRVFYGNKPAICEVTPWEHASVSVGLRYSRRDAARLYVEKYGDIDKDGCFHILLTQSQIDMIKSGNYSIDISHPSYRSNRTSYLIQFPFEMLSKEKASLEGYNIFNDSRVKSENLSGVLNSIDKLKELFIVLEKYANDNSNIYPEMLGFLDVENENKEWLAENIEYFPVTKSQDVSESAKTVIAYDKTLLEKYDATLVLFRDGHIEYCWPRELEILGIKKAEVEQLP